MSLFFPDPPREFPGQRAVKITLRALHVLCVCLLVGAHAYEAPAADRALALVATAGSGGVILLLDLYETAAFLLQVRGLVVMFKLFGVALIPFCAPPTSTVMLGAIVLISVLSSHAPARWRYRVMWFSDRVRGADTPG